MASDAGSACPLFDPGAGQQNAGAQCESAFTESVIGFGRLGNGAPPIGFPGFWRLSGLGSGRRSRLKACAFRRHWARSSLPGATVNCLPSLKRTLMGAGVALKAR